MNRLVYYLDEAWSAAASEYQGESIQAINRKLNNIVGAKAGNLARLRYHNFNVPNGFILDIHFYQRFLERSGLADCISTNLDALYLTNINMVSKRITNKIKTADFSVLLPVIAEFMEEGKAYAVRSSAILEDLDNQSFAGQYDTTLFCNSKEEVLEGIRACYLSLFSEANLHYVLDHGLPLEKLQMSVLIQNMIDADCAGVLFTVNPISGRDTEMLIEVIKGVSERLVAGFINGERYRFDWRTDEWLEIPKGKPILGLFNREVLVQTALALQVHFGRPQDVEFAFFMDELFIVQSRPVSSIQFQGYDYMWSTADFKDGGVSSTVCKPYMWSLYEYVWEEKLRAFIVQGKILRPQQMPPKLGQMFFGRPYWNLSVVKQAMSKIPGYVEEDFDQEYGIKKTYKGRGETTGITPGSLYHVSKIGLALRIFMREQDNKLKTFPQERKARYDELMAILEDQNQANNKIIVMWYHLTRYEYMETEGTYFQQIFLNTVQQALYKEKICKYISESDYLSLLSGLEDISHLRPFHFMWDISRAIREDEAKTSSWQNDAAKIVEDYFRKPSDFPELQDFIAQFGYHSDRELDVSYPNYSEDPSSVIKSIQNLILVEDEQAPAIDLKRQQEQYQMMHDKLLSLAEPRQSKKLEETISKMRTMLWWREELRDISTQYYHLIRLYTKRLGEILAEEGAISEADDIWFTTVEDLWKFFDDERALDLKTIVHHNRQYYDAYRCFQNANEIGQSLRQQAKPIIHGDTSVLKGLGCNQGVLTARARVVHSLEEIGKIEPGEILVTKFTDTGWTPKFATLGGVITEYGGLLCHAAIVSREYGLPCIVHLEDACQKIPDGAEITMDGGTGEVFIKKGNRP